MKPITLILMVITAAILGGCSHSRWAELELATQGASWLNPVATVVHMTTSAGRAMTDPEDGLREKARQCEEEQEIPPPEPQPSPPPTEMK